MPITPIRLRSTAATAFAQPQLHRPQALSPSQPPLTAPQSSPIIPYHRLPSFLVVIATPHITVERKQRTHLSDV
jgi:hypothetical protein